MIKSKSITPILIFLILLEIVLILFAIYYLFINNNNGNALGGIIAFIGSLINLLLIAFERIIVNIKGINLKILWTIEIIVIIFVVVYFAINGISIG